MKVIIISLAVLILSMFLCIANMFVINRKTEVMLSLVNESLASVREGDLKTGREKLAEAQILWERDKTYFCCVLRHSETDEIYTQFQTAMGSLDSGDKKDFSSQCSMLISHIELIQETEALTFGNIM